MRTKHTGLFPPRRGIAAALTATAALSVTALAGSTRSAESATPSSAHGDVVVHVNRLVPSPLNRAGVRDG
jgi:hypothetical protein